MSRLLSALHGVFGRACLYKQDRPMAIHAHREAHLIFHVGGQKTPVSVSGQVIEPDEFTAIAVNPLQPHYLSGAVPQQPMINLVLYINQSWFDNASDDSNKGLEFGCNKLLINEKIKKLVDKVVKLLTQGDSLDQFDNQLHDLASACHEQSLRQAAATANKLPSEVMVLDRRVNQAIEMMHERIHECIANDFVLTDIAREAGLSRPHFFKLFRSNTGVTPKVYKNTLLVEQALERILNTDLPVTSIALDLGFASQPSFSRFFSANVGTSPSGYRRAALKIC